jgi:hypothetical protein
LSRVDKGLGNPQFKGLDANWIFSLFII